MQSDYSELVDVLNCIDRAGVWNAKPPKLVHPVCDEAATAITTLQAERDAAWNEAIEAAAKAVMGYVHPDPDRLPGEMFASAQIRAMKKDA